MKSSSTAKMTVRCARVTKRSRSGASLAWQRKGDRGRACDPGAVRHASGGEAKGSDDFVELARVVAVGDRRDDFVAVHATVVPNPEGHAERGASQLLRGIVEGKREIAQLGRANGAVAARARPGPGAGPVAGPPARLAAGASTGAAVAARSGPSPGRLGPPRANWRRAPNPPADSPEPPPRARTGGVSTFGGGSTGAGGTFGIAGAAVFGGEGRVIYAEPLPPPPPPPPTRNSDRVPGSIVRRHRRSPCVSTKTSSAACSTSETTRPPWRRRAPGSRRLGGCGSVGRSSRYHGVRPER